MTNRISTKTTLTIVELLKEIGNTLGEVESSNPECLDELATAKASVVISLQMVNRLRISLNDAMFAIDAIYSETNDKTLQAAMTNVNRLHETIGK